MKITAIETIFVRIPYRGASQSKAEVWGGKPWTTADALLVRVDTDAGVTGWGEAFGYNVIPATRAAIDQIIAPLYIGRDPLAAESLMHEMQQKLHIFGRGGPVIYGLSGIDIALWDIAGKAMGQPLHRLLGGSSATALRSYASLMRYTEPKLVAAGVERAIEQGFAHVKLHEVELASIRAARKAAGPDTAIMLDVNCPWNLQQAAEMAARLREVEPFWLEEPVWPPEDHAALAELRATSGIPIAAGENAATLAHYQQMLQAGAVDYLQPSPAKMGGVTELRKVFALAAAHNVTVVPHTFYDGPALLAGLHVNATFGRDPLAEWRFVDLEARLYGDAAAPRDGMISLPGGAGLGVDPDAEVIRRYRAD
jgi:L-alanine-DL-glutamate epimerase-like enolase superfamily enzyme